MKWRIALASVFVLMLGAGTDYLEHTAFRSVSVVSSEDHNYAIQCTGVRFGRGATLVELKVIDNSASPRFEVFRKTFTPAFQVKGFSENLSLRVDLPYTSSLAQISMPVFSTTPAVLFYPKPNNQIHEAELDVWFQHVGPAQPGKMFGVDEAILKFPTFPEITAKRLKPLSQEESLVNDYHKNILVFLNDHERLVLPMLLIGLIGVVVFMGWIFWDLEKSRVGREFREGAAAGSTGKGKMHVDIKMPTVWNAELIGLQVASLHDRPEALRFFTQSLVKRFVIGQAEKTARTRIEYLRTILAEVKLGKELQAELDDLELREIDLDIRRLQKEIEKGDLEHRRRMQHELHAAEHKRDLLKVKADSAKYEKEIRDTKERPEKVGNQGSNARIQELRDHIQRAKEQRAFAREILTDPDELKREENRYDNQIAELQEELDTLR